MAAPFAMYRIFCSSPGDLDVERELFQDVIGRSNEDGGLADGVLFVPVILRGLAASLGNSLPAVRQNVRDADFFVQILGTSWGPDAAGFADLFELAVERRGAFNVDMREVAVFLKDVDPGRIQPAVTSFRERAGTLDRVPVSVFKNPLELEQRLLATLTAWRVALVGSHARE